MLSLGTIFSYVQNLPADDQMNKQLLADVPGIKRIRVEQVVQKDKKNTWGNETVFPQDSSAKSGYPEKGHLDQMMAGVFSVFNDGSNCIISYPLSDKDGNIGSIITFDTDIPYNSDVETYNDYEFDVLFFNNESVLYYDFATRESMSWNTLSSTFTCPLLFKTSEHGNSLSDEVLYKSMVAVPDNKLSPMVNADMLLRSLLGRLQRTAAGQVDTAHVDDIRILHETKDGALFSAVVSLGHRNIELSRVIWNTHSLYASYMQAEGKCVLNIIGNNAISYIPGNAPDSKNVEEMFADTLIKPYLFSIQPLQERVYQYRIDSVQKKSDSTTSDLKYQIKFSVLTSHMDYTHWTIDDGIMYADGWVIGKSCEMDLIKHGEYFEAVINLQKG